MTAARRRGGAGAAEGRQRWARRFALRALLWSLPATAAWLLAATPYNALLAGAGEGLVRLTERPAVTRLTLVRGHDILITRSDTRAGGRLPRGLRATDLHFPVVLLLATFLAVPGVPAATRWGNLGWALLASVAFHLLDLVFWVKFLYATQLGEWSLRHYGPWARNFWGLGKHLVDLPLKLALPVGLWAWFYLPALRQTASDGR